MTTRDILIQARALIEDPKHWTKGEDARAEDGDGCDIYSEEAVCWCAGGAIIRAGQRHDHEAALRVFRLVTIGDDVETVVYPWNDADETTHAEVLAAFDKAIAESA